MANVLLILFFAMGLIGDTPPSPCKEKKLPRFEDHQLSSTYKGKPHLPILVTKLDRRYQTAIRSAVAAGPNFSGHFAIAKWGCGTGCQEFVIVDVSTGTVYDPSFDGIGYHYPATPDYDPGWQCYQDLVTYRLSSRLLILEGCLLRGKQCGRTYLVMEAGQLRQVAHDPDLLRDGKIAPY